jgi:hypothetical protein
LLRLGCGKRFADVAQLVEHSLGKGEVISSILIIGSRVEAFCGCERSGSPQPKSRAFYARDLVVVIGGPGS